MGIFCGFYLIAAFLIFVLFPDQPIAETLASGELTRAQITQYKWMQLISALLTFLVPALIFNYLSDPNPLRYAGVRRKTPIALIALTLVLLTVSLPVVSTLGWLNEQIHFDNMHDQLVATEETQNKLMNGMLKMEGPGDLMINLFLMALLPALAEELFFRSTFQQLMERTMKNPVAAVVSASLFFSLMHLTAFKFLPILAMGILLGTLFVLTRNILYSIIFHFLFNGIQIVVQYVSQTHSIPGFDQSRQEIDFPVWVGAAGIIVIILIFVFIRKERGRWVSRDDY